mmetsp:Transcript_8558/g.25762  ORF Transcript_8558/g.25762 Transcript_8558/m.25762 type:complete len:222 (+) Transcript_8558:469-1134(+)
MAACVGRPRAAAATAFTRSPPSRHTRRRPDEWFTSARTQPPASTATAASSSVGARPCSATHQSTSASASRPPAPWNWSSHCELPVRMAVRSCRSASNGGRSGRARSAAMDLESDSLRRLDCESVRAYISQSFTFSASGLARIAALAASGRAICLSTASKYALTSFSPALDAMALRSEFRLKLFGSDLRLETAAPALQRLALRLGGRRHARRTAVSSAVGRS